MHASDPVALLRACVGSVVCTVRAGPCVCIWSFMYLTLSAASVTHVTSSAIQLELSTRSKELASDAVLYGSRYLIMFFWELVMDLFILA